jgi:hypothetical protein
MNVKAPFSDVCYSRLSSENFGLVVEVSGRMTETRGREQSSGFVQVIELSLNHSLTYRRIVFGGPTSRSLHSTMISFAIL